jgi:hypothetical protein
MTHTFDRFVLWTPRILGLALSVFLGLFALDVFSKPSLDRAMLEFTIHLIPAIVVLVLVAASWRREWIAGLSFVALSAAYGVSVGRAHPDWIVAISGPLLVVGGVFLWSWRHRRDRKPA